MNVVPTVAVPVSRSGDAEDALTVTFSKQDDDKVAMPPHRLSDPPCMVLCPIFSSAVSGLTAPRLTTGLIHSCIK